MDASTPRNRTVQKPRLSGGLEWAMAGPWMFVLLCLALLTILPLITERRVRDMRRELTEEGDPARILVNDEEAALATQLVGLGEIARGDTAHGLARYDRALTDEASDERQLGALVRSISPEADERFTELRTIAAHWHDRVGAALAGTDRQGVGGALNESGDERLGAEAVVLSAERLDNLLEDLARLQRERIREVERLDVWLPAVLAPIAFLSGFVVLLAGRRSVRLAHEAESGRQALARAMDTKAVMMRGITHDLKNPLGAAMAYAELLEDGVVGPLAIEQRDMIARIRRLVALSVETVTELLHLSQAEAGDLRLDRSCVDVAPIVRETAADYRAAADTAGLALEVQIPGHPVRARCDPSRTRQVLGNLLSNAIKYTPRGGRVCVALLDGADGGGPGGVAVEVRDTGCGIPPSLHERVFEEFYRAPDAHAMANGSGLGLAIGRRIARLMGGDVTLRSARGEGSTFTLTLPPAGDHDD